MKDASKPFAWLVLEYLFGSDVSSTEQQVAQLGLSEPKKPEVLPDPEECKRVKPKEESWAFEIRG